MTPEAISELAEALEDACQSRLEDLATGACCPMGALLGVSPLPMSFQMERVGITEPAAHEFMTGYDNFFPRPSALYDLGRQFRERYRGRL